MYFRDVVATFFSNVKRFIAVDSLYEHHAYPKYIHISLYKGLYSMCMVCVCVYANVGYDLKLSHIADGIAVGEVTKYNIKWMFEPEEGAHKQNPNLNPNQTHID